MMAGHRYEIPDLASFIVPNVRSTGRELGKGAYGSVEEVEIPGAVCAAKKIHAEFLNIGSREDASYMFSKFASECRLMSKLRHPHIVQFLGVCYLPGARLPSLVMERLDTNLHDLLETTPDLPLSIKSSILLDTARGLLYLHSQSPPIIHRDLTARNVLLNSAIVAKIADLGVARIVDRQPNQLATMTQGPGNIVYMPPEAMGEHAQYNSSLDIFSFGNIALFTLTQEFIGPKLKAATYTDDVGKINARSEIERRENSFSILYHINLGEESAPVQLIRACLQNHPANRPNASDLVERIKEIFSDMYSPSKLELIKQQSRNEKDIKEMEERNKVLMSQIEQLQDQNLILQQQLSQDRSSIQQQEIKKKDVQLMELHKVVRKQKEQIQHTEKRLTDMLTQGSSAKSSSSDASVVATNVKQSSKEVDEITFTVNYRGRRTVLHVLKYLKTSQVVEMAAKQLMVDPQGLVILYHGLEIPDDVKIGDALCKASNITVVHLVKAMQGSSAKSSSSSASVVATNIKQNSEEVVHKKKVNMQSSQVPILTFTVNFQGSRTVLHVPKDVKVSQAIQKAAEQFRILDRQGLSFLYHGLEITDDMKIGDALSKVSNVTVVHLIRVTLNKVYAYARPVLQSNEGKLYGFCLNCSSLCEVCEVFVCRKCKKHENFQRISSELINHFSPILDQDLLKGVCSCTPVHAVHASVTFKCGACPPLPGVSVSVLRLVRDNIHKVPCMKCGNTEDLVFRFTCSQHHVTCLGCFSKYCQLMLNYNKFRSFENGYSVGCPGRGSDCANASVPDPHHFQIVDDDLKFFNKFIDRSACTIDPGEDILCACKTLIDPGPYTETKTQELASDERWYQRMFRKSQPTLDLTKRRKTTCKRCQLEYCVDCKQLWHEGDCKRVTQLKDMNIEEIPFQIDASRAARGCWPVEKKETKYY